MKKTTLTLQKSNQECNATGPLLVVFILEGAVLNMYFEGRGAVWVRDPAGLLPTTKLPESRKYKEYVKKNPPPQVGHFCISFVFFFVFCGAGLGRAIHGPIPV